MRRKTTFANIHVKNVTHVTELELNTRAFAPPFVHIPFIPVGRTKECQECGKIFLQVGSSAVRFKNVPLTTESKISLRSRSCSPATTKIIDLYRSRSLLFNKRMETNQGKRVIWIVLRFSNSQQITSTNHFRLFVARSRSSKHRCGKEFLMRTPH